MAPTFSTTVLHRLRLIDRLAAFVDEHLNRPLTLDVLAMEVGLSKYHLHRVLVSQTGLTPGQFVAAARLQTAMTRLVSSRAAQSRIIDIAMSVGFEDASAFSRCFRRGFGVRPRDILKGTPLSGGLLLPNVGFRPPQEPASLVHLAGFYAYGYHAVGEHERTFAREAPAAFQATFEVVERHGIEEVLGPMALPSGQPWALPGNRRLLCAFRASKRLSLPRLTEAYVPSGDYLTLRHIGPYASRWQTWLKLAAIRHGFASTGTRSPRSGRRPFEIDRPATEQGLPVADIYIPL